MKIIFAGTPNNAAVTLDALVNSGHNVVAVLTREDAEVGRKRILTPSAVAITAEKHNLPIIKANRITPEVNQQIASFEPDLGVAVAYGVIFKNETLSVPNKGWINLHYSLLPAWRGAAPVQHALLSGQQTTGVTIFQLDEGMDTGPMLLTLPTQIEPGENAGDLLERLTHLAISGLLEVLPAIEAGIAVATPQPQVGASLAGKFNRNDAKIDWTKRARNIEFLVRALNPEPMAWANSDDSQIRILDAVALGAIQPSSSSFSAEAPIGSVQLVGTKAQVLCADHTILELKTVQPAGKSAMPAADWARGLKKVTVLS